MFILSGKLKLLEIILNSINDDEWDAELKDIDGNDWPTIEEEELDAEQEANHQEYLNELYDGADFEVPDEPEYFPEVVLINTIISKYILNHVVEHGGKFNIDDSSVIVPLSENTAFAAICSLT